MIRFLALVGLLVAAVWLLLTVGCATGGHYIAIPPDPAACSAAVPAIALAQAPCDVKPPPPAAEIVACVARAFAASVPCHPGWQFVPDAAPVKPPLPATP